MSHGYDGLNPTTAGRPCPLRLAEKCPGHHEGCAFWRFQHVEMGGQQSVIGNCTLVLAMEAGARGVGEQIGTQAVIQHMSNQLVANVAAMVLRGRPPLLSGNLGADRERVKALAQEAGDALRDLSG